MIMLDNVTNKLRKKTSRLRKSIKRKLPVGGIAPADRKRAAEITERGRHEYNMGLYDLAASFFEKALELDPRNQKALYSLANTYYKLKKVKEAVAKWRACIKVNPQDAVADKARRKIQHVAKLSVQLDQHLRELEEEFSD